MVAINPRLIRKQMPHFLLLLIFTFQRMTMGETVRKKSVAMAKPD